MSVAFNRVEIYNLKNPEEIYIYRHIHIQMYKVHISYKTTIVLLFLVSYELL